ncbi:mitogen-activated protein kinase kinase kinase, partial [Sarracenia purpurea var. burkii]
MASQKLNGVGRFQDKLPTSAPTSPISSPAQSPQRIARDIFMSNHISSRVNQVWSAPEMPHLDMNFGLGFSYQMSPEQTAFSVDSSPLQSPRVSPQTPHRSTRSPSGSTSPLNTRLSLETPSTWRDSNAQAIVHPLPLPPRVASPSQSKPELMPIKPQWQKGKLIGRGTFGSVYVGSN